MNLKRMAKKCECGRVSDPIHLEIVTDTWMKGGYVYFEYDCPQCVKKLQIKRLIED